MNGVFRPDALQRSHTLAVALVVLFAAVLRLYWNDIEDYAPLADEGHYLTDVQTVVHGGIASYPIVVDRFLSDPARWVFPNPLRWGYVGVASVFCGVSGDVSLRALATLSTVAGILTVLLTWLVGSELLTQQAAIIGAALVAVSPLQLGLGRRALADELFCLSFFVALFLLLRHLRAQRSRGRITWLIAWVVATTMTIAIKEQFLFIYPIVLLFWWLRSDRHLHWRLVAVWMLPPLLFATAFCLLSSSLTKFFRVAWIITSEMGAPYAQQYQSGPPQRILIDFLAIAPLVTLGSIVAAGILLLRPAERDGGEWHLAILLAGIVAVHALLPSKNLRYVIEADPLARLLLASLAWKEIRSRGLGWITAGAGLAINGAVELMLFMTVFVNHEVYDPVTDALLRALDMLPR
jgi:branched-subunit amino acid transport protein